MSLGQKGIHLMNSLGRVLALDVGDVRIGVASSDPLRIIASPYSVITRTTMEKDLEAICAVIAEREAVRVVVGLPLGIDGTPGAQAGMMLEDVEQLRGVTGVEIVTQDERFSTAGAQRMLIDANVSRKNRKKVIDKIAAQHILQVHLDRAKRI